MLRFHSFIKILICFIYTTSIKKFPVKLNLIIIHPLLVYRVLKEEISFFKADNMLTIDSISPMGKLSIVPELRLHFFLLRYNTRKLVSKPVWLWITRSTTFYLFQTYKQWFIMPSSNCRKVVIENYKITFHAKYNFIAVHYRKFKTLSQVYFE